MKCLFRKFLSPRSQAPLERIAAKLCFASLGNLGGWIKREAELPGMRSQAELGNEEREDSSFPAKAGLNENVYSASLPRIFFRRSLRGRGLARPFPHAIC